MNKLLRFVRGHEPDVNALSAQLDGQLDAAAVAHLDEHVASCEACRGVRDGLRATRDALRAMPAATPQRAFRLRAADVEAATTAHAPRSPRLTRWAPAGMVAAAVAIAVVGAYVTFVRGSSSSTSELAAARPATSASGAQQSNTTNGTTEKSAPGPSGGAPPVADSPAAGSAAPPANSILPPSPQAAADSSIATDDSSTPLAALSAPYSGSATPTPVAAPPNADVAAPSVTGGLQATHTADEYRNKVTAAVVIATTW